MTVTQLLGATGTGSIVERFTFDWSDLVGTADTTKTVIMKALPKAAIIEWVRIKHSVYFRGGSISTFTVSVGSAAGNGTEFASAYSIYAAVADTTFALCANSPNAVTYAADSLEAIFTSSHNMTALTSGSVFIDVKYWLPSKDASDTLL